MAALAIAARSAIRVLSVIPLGQLGIRLPSKRARTPTIATRAQRATTNEIISMSHDPPERCLDCPERMEEPENSVEIS